MLTFLALAALSFTSAQADAQAPEAPAKQPTVIEQELPSYPLTTCVVSGQPLDAMGGPVDVVHEGHLVRLCCSKCVAALPKLGDEPRKQVVAAVIAAQKPTYPLTKCPVADVELTEQKSVDVVVGTRLVRVCCERCEAKVVKDPAPYLATVDAALIAAQLESYPLTTCIVSGEPLDAMGEPLDKLYGVELVRLCCGGCERAFDRTPEKFLPTLRAAQREAKAPADAEQGGK